MAALMAQNVTVIHIAGLGHGNGNAMLAFLFMHDEISFDDFQQNAPQLYRLTTTITDADNDKQTLGTNGQVQGRHLKLPSGDCRLRENIRHERRQFYGQ